METLMRRSWKTNDRIFVASLNMVNHILERLEAEDDKPPEAKDDDKPLDITELVPPEYHDFLDLFSKKKGEALPPHRPYDHRINLKEGFTPPHRALYAMSRNELKAMAKFLKENLPTGRVRPSNSEAAAPVLFAKKKDGTLRVCFDYRGLNAGTIKDRYPLPLFSETIVQLKGAKYFTKLDLRGAYNLIRMAEGEEWKTAFHTRWGLFECLVMPFGLCNAPATMQRFINDTLRDCLDLFATAYLDDILIYSKTLEEHRQHVCAVLEKLKKAGLYLKPEKCEFHKTQVEYHGLIVSTEGIEMDPTKVATVLEWEEPQNVKDVQSFLGFANFYRRFIEGYSKIVAPPNQPDPQRCLIQLRSMV